jgi:pimeloyl-ACP methyl ester carboxylesterase
METYAQDGQTMAVGQVEQAKDSGGTYAKLDGTSSGVGHSFWRAMGGLCCCACLVMLVTVIAVLVFCAYMAPKFVELDIDTNVPLTNDTNGTTLLWTPDNFTQIMDVPSDCFYGKDLLSNIASFNSNVTHLRWKEATYYSRTGDAGQSTVLVRGWWLPAPCTPPNCPRVVMVHGMQKNWNDFPIHVAAVMMRQLGFSVLVTELRDHGLAGASDHPGYHGVGWDYHLDVLGAWDFLVQDTDGALGGPVDPSLVGVFGMGYGGGIALTAAGLESSIPGVWLESPEVYHDMRYIRMMKMYLSESLQPFAAQMFPISWYFAKWKAGIDLDHINPEKALAKRRGKAVPGVLPKSFPIMFAHGQYDRSAWIEQSESMVEDLMEFNVPYTLDNGNRGDNVYNMTEWYPAGPACGQGSAKHHNLLSVANSQGYRQRLCDFWSHVFGLASGPCNLEHLPPLGTNDQDKVLEQSDAWKFEHAKKGGANLLRPSGAVGLVVAVAAVLKNGV